MEIIFQIIATALNIIANITGLSYEEINILVYYFVIPFTYFVLIDLYFRIHYLKIIWIVFSIIILATVKFSDFSDWLFNKSVSFLESFHPIGLDYTNASVFICVFLVLLIYSVLITVVISKRLTILIFKNKGIKT
jgi:hypothetical protein